MSKFSLLVSSAVVSLGMIANANAATQNSAGLFEVNLPNFQQNWFKLSVEGDYFKPSIGSGDYHPQGAVGMGPHTTVSLGNFPKSDWGFAVGAAYYMVGTSNDVSANYQRYSTIQNAEFTDPEAAGNGSLTGKIGVTYQSDIYDLSLGQNMNIGKNLNARAFVGGRFVNLKVTQDLTNYGIEGPRGAANSTTTSITAGGPRVGIEGIYHIWNGFGISATAATSALIGNTNTLVTVGNAPILGITSTTELQQNTSTVTISNDLKAGINYTFQSPVYALTGEVGYKLTQFRNAIPTNGVVADYGTTSQTGDVIFQGPYAKVSVMF